MKSIQQYILNLAIRKSKTQANLAEFLGTNQVQISRYHTGKRDMPLSLFLKVLRFLGGKIELRNR